jgi:HK97 family phage major capsid protein
MKIERTLEIEARAKDEQGLIEMAISSEAPYERWFGIEILRHSAEAVDLTRLNDGRHPLLINHDTNQQAGVIKSAWLDEDRKLRGKAKFSRSAFGKEIEQDVADGIRSLVSVGYEIREIEEVEEDQNTKELTTVRKFTGDEFEREMRAQHGDHFHRAGLAASRAKGSKPPTFVVTRWAPFEASLVAIPADVEVGVGRAAGAADASNLQQHHQPAPAAPAASQTSHQEIRIMTQAAAPDAAALEAKRVADILALGEQYGKYVGQKDIADAIRNGRTVEQFTNLILQKMESAHTDTRAMEIGMTQKEIKRYSFGRALVASLSGDWSKAGLERECSQALEKLWGRSPEGFFLPFEAMKRDFNVGTGTEAGNLVPTDLRGDLYVDALRNNLVMGRLGVTILAGLTGNVDIPRKATPTTVGRLTEIGSASETQPLTAKATLSPKRVGGYVEVSKQALIQAALPLEGMIRDDLLMSAAVELENQSLNGNGTAPNIQGLRNYTTIGSTTAGANGAAPTWGHFVDLESACANSNAEPDRLSGYIINTRTRGRLKQTQMGTNLPFIWMNSAQPVNGYRAEVTNNLPNNLTKGTSTTVCSAAVFSSDWSMAVIGLFGAPDVIVDPYTKADTGQVKITLNQFSDMAIRQPAAFSKIEDLLSN